MFKALLRGIICVTMLMGGGMQKQTVQEYLVDCSQATIIVDNKYINIENVKQLNDVINDMIKDSHTMPAFGVSIHIETLSAIQNGVWLKLQYNGTQSVDDMVFDELLIEVNPKFGGFNIIRGNRGIYDGRCFYIDLVDKNMSTLYNFILLQST